MNAGPSTPAGGTVRVGELEVLPLLDGSARFPPAVAYRSTAPEGFKGRDEADWEPHRDFLADDGTLEITLGGFLIRGTGDRAVLVDGGVGPDPHPLLPRAGGQLLDSLAAAGVDRTQVTDVVFTHLHFDHYGWASRGGEPVFPNATYRCDRRDWEHFVGHDEHATERLRPVERQFETWDGDVNLAPGVDTRLCAGHTPGSALIVLSSGDQRALLLGDVVHCAVELLDDEWAGLADVDPARAREVRNALARELEGTDVPVAAAHFPGLRFGRMIAGEGRRYWAFD